jgi:hypothetical protein
MKKIQTLLLCVLLPCAMASAQDQLENVSFEQWEDILASETDTIREPINWSSLKTSDDPTLATLAPVVCTRSSDAHSGQYSLELNNVQSFIIVNGVATNGRIHAVINAAEAYSYTDTEDSQWNTPFTGSPDSIAGWVKYTPQGNDTLQIKVNLHRGFGKQPDADYTENWVGMAEYKSPQNSSDGWVRFSTPFSYFKDIDPEYALVTLNSGNGFFPVAGSHLLVDDLEMIYNLPQSNKSRMKQVDGSLYAVGNRQLVIKGMDPSLFHTINIFDISGKLLWSDKLTSDQINITPANLGNGLYLIKLSGKSTLFTQKIMLR